MKKVDNICRGFVLISSPMDLGTGQIPYSEGIDSAMQRSWPIPRGLSRLILTDPREEDTLLPSGGERITEIVATDITRHASPPL